MKEYTKLQGGELEVTIPIRLKYDGHKTVINLPEDAPPPLDVATMNPMQKALVQGMRFREAPRRSRRRSRAKSTVWRWSTSPPRSATA